ncbi:MAG: hypothetical protein K8S98_12615 [Planctomycetes bacterium]|nr:hypothetical protein [Planctomycetota bacterium]
MFGVGFLVCIALAQTPSAPALPSDDELRRGWSLLTDAERADVAAHFAEEARFLDGLQRALIEHALSLDETDPGLLPVDAGTPVFDPNVHAPAQPIARNVLEFDAPAARNERERLLKRVPKTGLDPAFRYDWGRRLVVRLADPEDAERVFANGLTGHPPRYDLALAQVERELDRGEEQKTLAAFDHAYTDRAGTVYPGITLFDAWSSGAEMEMPDVDVLGVVHDVLGDWKTWKAVIPNEQHEGIYDKVGELYLRARDYRGLRAALASTYLSGTVPLVDGYVGHRLRLHGLWESAISMPKELSAKLPDAAHRQEFLVAWSESFDKNAELVPRAQARQAELDRDAQRVHDVLARILVETGALQRKQRPPEPAKSKSSRSGG